MNKLFSKTNNTFTAFPALRLSGDPLSTLTHLVSQDPSFRLCVHFDQNGWRADEQHEQVSDAQIGQENVCGVSHVLCLQYHDGHLNRSASGRRRPEGEEREV